MLAVLGDGNDFFQRHVSLIVPIAGQEADSPVLGDWRKLDAAVGIRWILLRARHRMGNQVDTVLHFLQGASGIVGGYTIVDGDCLHRVAVTESVAAQQGGESLAEVRVEGVDDGVEGGVGPAEPNKHIESAATDAGQGGCRAAGVGLCLTKGHDAIQDKEWQPAAHEHPHDDRQGLENFSLSLERHLEGALGRLHVHVAAAAPVALAVLGVHGCPLQRRDAPNLFLGDPVDPGVGDDHDGHWDVKTDQGRRYSIGPVQAGVTVVPWMVGTVVVQYSGGFSLVPIQLHWYKGDED